jgi:hypothetical protein
MKYLLFAGYSYYPSGGAKEFIASFDTPEDAKAEYDRKLEAEEVENYLGWGEVAVWDGTHLTPLFRRNATRSKWMAPADRGF